MYMYIDTYIHTYIHTYNSQHDLTVSSGASEQSISEDFDQHASSPERDASDPSCASEEHLHVEHELSRDDDYSDGVQAVHENDGGDHRESNEEYADAQYANEDFGEEDDSYTLGVCLCMFACMCV